MRIAVIGASRGAGFAAVEEALARGWSVNALARNPEQAGLKHPRLVWYKGDARTELLLDQALKGCDAVAVAISAGPKSGQYVTVFSDAMNVLMKVMNREQIKRLVFVSGFGAGDTKGRGGFWHDSVVTPFKRRKEYDDMDRAEALIMKSHKDWTIIRPGNLTNRTRTHRVQALTNAADYRLGSLSRADLGWYICECIGRGYHVHETPVLIAGR